MSINRELSQLASFIDVQEDNNFIGISTGGTYAVGIGTSSVIIGSTGIITATQFHGPSGSSLIDRIDLQDEGSPVGTGFTTLNFVGTGVTITEGASGIATVTITGTAIIGTGGEVEVTDNGDGTTTLSLADEVGITSSLTVGTVKIESGIITATSGIVTYHGDGSGLTNINASSLSGIATDSDKLDGQQGSYYLDTSATGQTKAGDLTLSKSGTPNLVVQTSSNSGQDALIKIRGARTSCNTCDIAMLQFDNKTSNAYTMAQISAMDPAGAHANGKGKLVFRTATGGTLSDQVTIMDDGDVGIGSEQPTAKLDVRGTVNVTGVTTFSDDLTIGSNTVETDINILGSTITYTDVVGGYGNEPTKFYGSNLSGTKNFVISVNHNTSSQQGGLLIRNATDTVAEFQHVPNTYTDFHPTPHCFEVYGGSIMIRNDREGADYLQAPPTLSLWNRVEGSSFTPGDEIHRIDFVAQDASGPGSGTIIRIADVINDTTGADHSLKFFTSDTPNGSPLTTSLSLGPKATELYYLGSKKFETTVNGIAVSGIVTASSGIVTYYGDGTNLTLTDSVALGGDTTGDYVASISGTANQIAVDITSGEGTTPVISIPTNPTLPGTTVTIENDLQVNRDLNVNGNITIGGTSATLFTQTLSVADADLILGVRTDANGNDVSTDTTASHGGIAIASTEGTPLVTLVNPGAGETLPATYKKIMWFEQGAFAGLGTDAWLINYGVGIGSTQVPNNVVLAAGDVHITNNDIKKVRDINATGIITASTFVSNVSTGTSPLTVTSTTLVSNLNADKLDGQEGTYYLNYANFSGIATDSDKLDGQQGSYYLDYANFSGIATDSDKLDGQQGTYYLDYANFSGIATDSDKLDGQQGSYYLDYSNFTNTPPDIRWFETAVGIWTSSSVGIGTTNPQTLLHVEKTTQGEIARFRASSDTRYLKISSFDSGFNGSGFDFNATSNAGEISFSTQNVEKVRIDNDGNLGIGTDSPLAKLDVRDGSVYVPGGTFDASSLGGGNDSKTDAALVIDRSSAIYVQSGGYLRNLIEPAGTVINIGQQNTSHFTEINLKPGAAGGSVKLHDGGTTDNVKLETTGYGVTITGGINVSGVATATDFNSASDENLKTNIRTIEDPLAKVVQIRGVNFDWKETQRPSLGVIAQEIEKVLPELVTDNGTKTVNYNGLIGLLIEAVKAQQEEIDILKSKIK